MANGDDRTVAEREADLAAKRLVDNPNPYGVPETPTEELPPKRSVRAAFVVIVEHEGNAWAAPLSVIEGGEPFPDGELNPGIVPAAGDGVDLMVIRRACLEILEDVRLAITQGATLPTILQAMQLRDQKAAVQEMTSRLASKGLHIPGVTTE